MRYLMHLWLSTCGALYAVSMWFGCVAEEECLGECCLVDLKFFMIVFCEFQEKLLKLNFNGVLKFKLFLNSKIQRQWFEF